MPHSTSSPLRAFIVPYLALCSLSMSCGGEEPPPLAPTLPRASLSDAAGKADDLKKGGVLTWSLHELLGADRRIPLEASGVVFGADDTASVVFDNFALLGRAGLGEEGELSEEGEEEDVGYEGLSFDVERGRYYALVEGIKRKKHVEPEVHVYDEAWHLIERQRVDFELEDVNKGMEGLAHLYHEDELYLLMLCESNDRSSKGKEGEGRIVAFTWEGEEWREADHVKLPKSLDFSDYSGLDLDGDRIIVSSQEEGAFWIGELSVKIDDEGRPDWSIEEEGEVYEMPRKSGKLVYCNIEGVSFSDQGIVLVSDRRKPDQSDRCEDQDESLHLVKLP